MKAETKTDREVISEITERAGVSNDMKSQSRSTRGFFSELCLFSVMIFSFNVQQSFHIGNC